MEDKVKEFARRMREDFKACPSVLRQIDKHEKELGHFCNGKEVWKPICTECKQEQK